MNNVDKLNYYKVEDNRYSKDDPDYFDNLNKFNDYRLLKFSSLDDCIAFYEMWFSIYREVLKNWDTVVDE